MLTLKNIINAPTLSELHSEFPHLIDTHEQTLQSQEFIRQREEILHPDSLTRRKNPPPGSIVSGHHSLHSSGSDLNQPPSLGTHHILSLSPSAESPHAATTHFLFQSHQRQLSSLSALPIVSHGTSSAQGGLTPSVIINDHDDTSSRNQQLTSSKFIQNSHQTSSKNLVGSVGSRGSFHALNSLSSLNSPHINNSSLTDVQSTIEALANILQYIPPEIPASIAYNKRVFQRFIQFEDDPATYDEAVNMADEDETLRDKNGFLSVRAGNHKDRIHDGTGRTNRVHAESNNSLYFNVSARGRASSGKQNESEANGMLEYYDEMEPSIFSYLIIANGNNCAEPSKFFCELHRNELVCRKEPNSRIKQIIPISFIDASDASILSDVNAIHGNGRNSRDSRVNGQIGGYGRDRMDSNQNDKKKALLGSRHSALSNGKKHARGGRGGKRPNQMLSDGGGSENKTELRDLPDNNLFLSHFKQLRQQRQKQETRARSRNSGNDAENCWIRDKTNDNFSFKIFSPSGVYICRCPSWKAKVSFIENIVSELEKMFDASTWRAKTEAAALLEPIEKEQYLLQMERRQQVMNSLTITGLALNVGLLGSANKDKSGVMRMLRHSSRPVSNAHNSRNVPSTPNVGSDGDNAVFSDSARNGGVAGAWKRARSGFDQNRMKWEDHFFVLAHSTLYYFSHDPDTQTAHSSMPKSFIPLKYASVCLEKEYIWHDRFVFRIRTPLRSIMLRCRHPIACAEWVSAVEHAIYKSQRYDSHRRVNKQLKQKKSQKSPQVQQTRMMGSGRINDQMKQMNAQNGLNRKKMNVFEPRSVSEVLEQIRCVRSRLGTLPKMLVLPEGIGLFETFLEKCGSKGKKKDEVGKVQGQSLLRCWMAILHFKECADDYVKKMELKNNSYFYENGVTVQSGMDLIEVIANEGENERKAQEFDFVTEENVFRRMRKHAKMIFDTFLSPESSSCIWYCHDFYESSNTSQRVDTIINEMRTFVTMEATAAQPTKPQTAPTTQTMQTSDTTPNTSLPAATPQTARSSNNADGGQSSESNSSTPEPRDAVAGSPASPGSPGSPDTPGSNKTKNESNTPQTTQTAQKSQNATQETKPGATPATRPEEDIYSVIMITSLLDEILQMLDHKLYSLFSVLSTNSTEFLKLKRRFDNNDKYFPLPLDRVVPNFNIKKRNSRHINLNIVNPDLSSRNFKIKRFFSSNPLGTTGGANATNGAKSVSNNMNNSGKTRFQVVTIGRDCSNAIVLDDPNVSRSHGRIKYNQECAFYTDLGSHHGSYLNGNRVLEERLQHGDTLKIGGCDVVFEVKDRFAADWNQSDGPNIDSINNTIQGSNANKSGSNEKNPIIRMFGGIFGKK